MGEYPFNALRDDSFLLFAFAFFSEIEISRRIKEQKKRARDTSKSQK